MAEAQLQPRPGANEISGRAPSPAFPPSCLGRCTQKQRRNTIIQGSETLLRLESCLNKLRLPSYQQIGQSRLTRSEPSMQPSNETYFETLEQIYWD